MGLQRARHDRATEQKQHLQNFMILFKSYPWKCESKKALLCRLEFSNSANTERIYGRESKIKSLLSKSLKSKQEKMTSTKKKKKMPQ